MPDERAMMRRMAEAMELYGRGLDAPDFWPALTAYKEHEAAGRAEAPDADEEATLAAYDALKPYDAAISAFQTRIGLARLRRDTAIREGEAAPHPSVVYMDEEVRAWLELIEALIAYRERRYVEALEQERAQFQRETLRTSELHRMLERAGSYIREVDGPDSPLARAFAREISELLAKPINAAAPASPEVE